MYVWIHVCVSVHVVCACGCMHVCVDTCVCECACMCVCVLDMYEFFSSLQRFLNARVKLYPAPHMCKGNIQPCIQAGMRCYMY